MKQKFLKLNPREMGASMKHILNNWVKVFIWEFAEGSPAPQMPSEDGLAQDGNQVLKESKE